MACRGRAAGRGRQAVNSPSQTLLQPPERVLSTLNADGSRRWLRPRVARGGFWRARRVVAYGLIGVFVLLPWLRVGGKPAVLLDIARREFTLLGKTFLPTDTILLALLVVSVLVGIFLVTALLGRVWCGWACPQTVYMEFLFRPIERWLEGEPGRARPTTAPGVRKAVKWLLFLGCSLVLAHTFLSYFVGVDALRVWITRSPLNHPGAFVLMAATTAAVMFDFCFFREQTCILACPYGRFQSVMLDSHSLIVSYDRLRGEPRGASRRASAAQLTLTQAPKAPCSQACRCGGACDGKGREHEHDHADEHDHRAKHAACGCGPDTPAPPPHALAPAVLAATDRRADCVDCGLCVAVCPTGIDIRNGLQLECIGCAQCIDACDAVMAKLQRPAGLIRYSSQAAMRREATRLIRPRVIAYPLILVALLGSLVALLATAAHAHVAITRGRGMPFNTLADGRIANQVAIKVTNRTGQAQHYTAEVTGVPGATLVLTDGPLDAGPGETVLRHARIEVGPDAFAAGPCDAQVCVGSTSGDFRTVQPFRLFGPAALAQPPTRATPAPRTP